jgi:hypothetical protein
VRLSTIHFWRRGNPRLTAHLIAAVSLIGLFSAIAPFSAAEEILYEQRLEPYAVPILVPAGIGGAHYMFMLDTGAFSIRSIRNCVACSAHGRRPKAFSPLAVILMSNFTDLRLSPSGAGIFLTRKQDSLISMDSGVSQVSISKASLGGAR